MLNVETQSDWQQLLVRKRFVPFRPHCDLVFLAFSSPSCAAFHAPWVDPAKSPCPSTVTFMLLCSVLYLDGYTPSHLLCTQAGFYGVLMSV